MTGRATSFVTSEDRDQLRAIETLLGHSVPLAEGSPGPMIVRIRGGWLNVPEVTVSGGGVQARTDAGISRVLSCRRGSRFPSAESHD